MFVKCIAAESSNLLSDTRSISYFKVDVEITH